MCTQDLINLEWGEAGTHGLGRRSQICAETIIGINKENCVWSES